MEENKRYINKILASMDSKKIAEMEDFICHLMKEVEEDDKEEMDRWLYEISEGKVLNEERARELIKAMKPYGLKWEFAETENVRNSNGLNDIRPVDFWIVMNSAYNDYEDIFKESLEHYVKFSKDFIMDEDAVDDKVYYYFTMIPKKAVD